MSEQNQNPLGFPEISGEDGIDVDAIFGTGAPVEGDPFAEPQQPSDPEQQTTPAAQEPLATPPVEAAPPVVEQPAAPTEQPNLKPKQKENPGSLPPKRSRAVRLRPQTIPSVPPLPRSRQKPTKPPPSPSLRSPRCLPTAAPRTPSPTRP